MNVVIKQINLMERIDQLIRLQATGTPDHLSERLEISRAKLYRIIEVMKELNAPIRYDLALQSFVYEEEVDLRFGFFVKNISRQESKSLNGGFYKEVQSLNHFEFIS